MSAGVPTTLGPSPARPSELSAAQVPAWFREMRGTLGVSAQYVLEGNVHDRYLLPGDDGTLRPVPGIIDAIWSALSEYAGGRGLEVLLLFDPADGLRAHPANDASRQLARQIVGAAMDGGVPTLERLSDVLPAIVHDREHSIALVVGLAGRLAPDPNHLSPEQLAFYTMAERLALSAVASPRTNGPSLPVHNPIIWLVERDRELPGWLLAHDDQIRLIGVPLPDEEVRAHYASLLLASLPGHKDTAEDVRREHVERFTQQTEGMTLNAMFAITVLARSQGIGAAHVEDAARAYRVGIVDNPWKTGRLRERLAQGEETIGCAVVGQRDAVRKSLDIMIRSATGLTGAHRSPYATRPRGVLFFAGPTGVGKTELAKQLTKLVFGSETAYVRFDMSEFSEQHTAARLIGAPPGYLGHDSGGELTNAIRQRPFSLVLFDEIEKAHGRILDKFLQILEDGRLTDGRGATVFFSEAVLVFTSNLGIWVPGPDGGRVANVTPDLDRDKAERRVLDAIKHHFTVELGRPELLNRLGDNIVVFDFITRDTAQQILDLLVRTVAARVEREHGATLTLSPAAAEQLAGFALANLDGGGRGVGSVVENALVNPLARAIFDRGHVADEDLEVVSITRTGRIYEVELA